MTTSEAAGGRTDADVAAAHPPLVLSDIGYRRGTSTILDSVSWTIEADQDWVVLGANGCGKTTLIRIAALYEHPSSGTVEVLGQLLGHADVRALRQRVALVSPAMSDMLRPQLTATEIVMCAKFAALEPWWHDYDDADRDRARSLLEDQGVGDRAEFAFGQLSSGERQRVLLSRALMGDPGLLLLDEPTAGLDLGGREQLVDRLDRLAVDPSAPPMALVTHHVEEIPATFSHLLAMRDGQVLARGPLDDTLDSEMLSECFGFPLAVSRHHDGRWSARRA